MAPPDGAARTAIRVADLQRAQAPVYALGDEALALLIEELDTALSFAPPNEQIATLRGLIQLVAGYRERLGHTPDLKSPETVLIRTLLGTRAVVPVVGSRLPQRADADALLIRPPIRRDAIVTGSEAMLGLPAEEPVQLAGLTTRPVRALAGFLRPIENMLVPLPSGETRADALAGFAYQIRQALEYAWSIYVPPEGRETSEGHTVPTSISSLLEAPDIAPEGELKRILAGIGSVYGLQAASYLAGLYALQAHGGLGLLGSADPEQLAHYVQQLQNARDRYNLETLQRFRVLVDQTRAQQYILIAQEKLGSKAQARLAGLSRGSATADRSQIGLPTDPESILAALPKADAQILRTEYDNLVEYWKQTVKNTCPHVALARQVQGAVNADEAVARLRRLREYYKRGHSADEWIPCRSCGFRVICPHVDLYITLREKNLPYDKIQAALRRYIAPVTTGDAHTAYCKICGGKLSSTIHEESVSERLGAVGDFGSALKLMLWGESIRAAQYLLFGVPTDPRRFANLASDVCHPLLVQAESALVRRGSRRAGDAEDPRTRLYAILFVYAFVLNLIRSSADRRLADEDRVGFRGVKTGSKVSKYAEVILQHIETAHRQLIASINEEHGISTEFIAARFQEAYRMVVNRNGDQLLHAADPARALLQWLVTIDPLYRYACTASQVAGATPLVLRNDPKKARAAFERVMGRTLDQLLDMRRREMGRQAQPESVDLYSKLWSYGRPQGMTKSEGRPKDPSLFQNSYARTRNLFAGSSLPTPGLEEQEQAAAVARRYRQLYPITHEEHQPVPYFGTPSPITAIYDEEGRPHKWGIYVYSQGEELTLPQISKRLESPSPPVLLEGQHLADMRCTVCGVLQSETGRLDPQRTQKSRARLVARETFFAYYETRCPAGGLHDYTSAATESDLRSDKTGVRCSKCGLEENGDAASQQAYYKKYRQQFEDERRLADTSEESVEGVVEIVELVEPAAETADLVGDFAVVRAAAEALSIPVEVLSHLGALEGYDYNEVVQGRSLPPSPTQMTSQAIQDARAAMLSLLAEYNRLRYFDSFVHPGALQAELLAQAKVPRDQYGALGLPDIFLNYTARLRQAEETLKPEELYRFLIESIASRLLLLVKHSKKEGGWSGRLALLFARRMAERLLMFSKLLSVPGRFDRSIFADRPPAAGDDQIDFVEAEKSEEFEDLDMESLTNLEVS